MNKIIVSLSLLLSMNLYAQGTNPYADGGTGGSSDGASSSLAGCEFVNAKLISCADGRDFILSTSSVNSLSRVNTKTDLPKAKAPKAGAKKAATKQ